MPVDYLSIAISQAMQAIQNTMSNTDRITGQPAQWPALLLHTGLHPNANYSKAQVSAQQQIGRCDQPLHDPGAARLRNAAIRDDMS